MSKPVALIRRNSSGQIYLASPDGEYFDISKHIGSNLHLGDELELKDAAIAELVGVLKDAEDYVYAVGGYSARLLAAIAKYERKDK